MRVPRVRFTVRRLMASAAIVGIVIGGVLKVPEWLERSREYQRRNWDFSEIRNALPTASIPAGIAPEDLKAYRLYQDRRREWADRMVWKYARASRYPWLPVAPDPPEPKWRPRSPGRD
jgi:hypothetical protein